MTLQEYLGTPETALPAELAYGVHRVADSPTPLHQRTVLRVVRALDDHATESGLGEAFVAPLDVILDEARALVVQPDVLFVSRAQASIVSDRVHGAPALVVEVLSPLPRIGEINEKVGWYARYGVRECWIVHQINRTVDVLQLSQVGIARRRLHRVSEPIESTVLPDFRRSLDSILGFPY
jgi:Uma2 family endonuclease